MSSFYLRNMNLSLVYSVPLLDTSDVTPTSSSSPLEYFLFTVEGILHANHLKSALSQSLETGERVVVLGQYCVVKHALNVWPFYEATALIQTTDDAPHGVSAMLLRNARDIVGLVPVEIALQILELVAQCVEGMLRGKLVVFLCF